MPSSVYAAGLAALQKAGAAKRPLAAKPPGAALPKPRTAIPKPGIAAGGSALGRITKPPPGIKPGGRAQAAEILAKRFGG